MHYSTLISIVIAAILLWAIAASARLLLLFVRGEQRHRFFSHPRGLSCHGLGHKGISLLCRDTGNPDRLRNLLAVEYPDYEVIVIADSLHSPDSLQQIIAHYHMVAVDGRISSEDGESRVRRMYRSVSRCYRRLLLLDIATTDSREDLDSALDAATYDYLLPLWGNEYLRAGAIERIIAEVCTESQNEKRIITTHIGPPSRLIPRQAAHEAGGISAVDEGRFGHHDIYEPLLSDSARDTLRWRIAAGVMVGIALLCIGTAIAGVMPLAMIMISLILVSILVAAYAAMITISNEGNAAIEYGESLSLFCKNLLPRIWKIRK